MEQLPENNTKLSQIKALTCLALSKVAHIEDMLSIAVPTAEELLSDISNGTNPNK
jgi:hypothetical protein